MVNERYDDKYEGQDDGEYHFSDDQANYDLEPEVPAKEAVITGPKVSLMERLKGSRKVVIGVIVFIVLCAIVYKMVMPSTPTAPPTEFSATATPVNPAPAKIEKPSKPQTAPIATVQPAPVPEQPAPMAQQAMPQQAPAVMSQPMQPSVAAMPAPAVIPSQPPMPATMPMNPVVESGPAKSFTDRLAAVEQQNTAMANALQTQYAQKMADYEAQNTQMRNQVQELNTRLASMEVAFHQLTKILRTMHERPAAAPMAGNSESPVFTPSATHAPRMSYTVQAIIPGRAWLKSDAGDTVTVAEGDSLKDYGRVTKIDPYDGVVAIDTGNKVVTLSYGVGGD